MTGDDSGREAAIEALLSVLDNSDWGKQNLPAILGYLDHDDRDVRVGAGWAITMVADEHPETVEYLARRLGDRLLAGGDGDDEAGSAGIPEGDSGDAPLPVQRCLDAVARRYPDVVAEELEAMIEEKESSEGAVDQRPDGASMVRANYHAPGPGDRPVGRIRRPSGRNADDPRQVYTGDQERTGRTQEEMDSSDADSSEADSSEADSSDADRSEADSSDADRSEADSSDVDPSEAASSEVDPSEADPTEDDPSAEDDALGPPGRELRAGTDALQHVAGASRFDELQVTAARRRGRNGDIYRTRATVAGEELPVALLFFHSPDGRHSVAFQRDLEDALERWNAVDDHDHVLTIHDWGLSPRPWALTEYAAASLRSTGDLALEDAHWNGQVLANALAHAHERGVVHAGIDPATVVYYGNVLDEDERQAPMFAYVGILAAVRQYFDPTGRLDPRYAAPEYFDRSYGRIDHATDIYQLGAVLYRLFTGEHPYDGDYETVRAAVLEGTPPRPSDVADVPPALDDVVTKAMGREKLRRYESVTHLAADLRATEVESDAR